MLNIYVQCSCRNQIVVDCIKKIEEKWPKFVPGFIFTLNNKEKDIFRFLTLYSLPWKYKDNVFLKS